MADIVERLRAEELIERLKRHALGSADEDTMRRWDGIRAYFKEGDRGASHPRDCFESIIDCYAEDCAAAATEIERLRQENEQLRDEWQKSLVEASVLRDALR